MRFARALAVAILSCCLRHGVQSSAAVAASRWSGGAGGPEARRRVAPTRTTPCEAGVRPRWSGADRRFGGRLRCRFPTTAVAPVTDADDNVYVAEIASVRSFDAAGAERCAPNLTPPTVPGKSTAGLALDPPRPSDCHGARHAVDLARSRNRAHPPFCPQRRGLLGHGADDRRGRLGVLRRRWRRQRLLERGCAPLGRLPGRVCAQHHHDRGRDRSRRRSRRGVVERGYPESQQRSPCALPARRQRRASMVQGPEPRERRGLGSRTGDRRRRNDWLARTKSTFTNDGTGPVIFAFQPDGTALGSAGFQKLLQASPAVDAEGDAVIAHLDGTSATRKDGSIRWSAPPGFAMSPALDGAGVAIIGDGQLHGVLDGVELWSAGLSDGSTARPVASSAFRSAPMARSTSSREIRIGSSRFGDVSVHGRLVIRITGGLEASPRRPRCGGTLRPPVCCYVRRSAPRGSRGRRTCERER